MNRLLTGAAIVFPVMIGSWPAILVSALLIWLELRIKGRTYAEIIPNHQNFGELTISVLFLVMLLFPAWYVAVGGSFQGYLIAFW